MRPDTPVRRILIVAPEFPPSVGGMQIHSWKTARLLSARSIEVEVLTAAGRDGLPEEPSFPVRRVLTRNFSRNLRAIRKATLQLDPDCILLMNAGFAPLASAGFAGFPPILVRTAGNDAYAPWDGPRLPLRFLFWRLPASDPTSLGARLRGLDQSRRAEAVLEGLRRCDRILCNSSYTVSRLRAQGIPSGLLRAVLGGVDTTHFSPEGAGSSARAPGGNAPTLGVAGHLLPIKGLEVAIRALPHLAGKASGARLRIAGAGPEEESLQRLVGSLALEERVEFAGEVSYEAMPQFYRSLDVYLQPSVEIRHPASGALQAESMGRAIAEAMSCGLPVVASRSGGIPDVVREGASGILVPPGEPASLAAAISRLLDSPETRRAFAEAARRHAVATFSWDSVVEAILGDTREVHRQAS